MSQRLAVPVHVENDANACAVAEAFWGAGTGAADVVYLKLSRGIGAGLILDDRLYGGALGTAGEIGHTTRTAEGELCRCGNRGCLETTAGIEAIARRAGQPGIAEVIAGADAGDVASRRALRDAGSEIGQAAAMICNVLNPRRIVIGGELAAAWPHLEASFRAALDRAAIARRRRRGRGRAGGARIARRGARRARPGAARWRPFHRRDDREDRMRIGMLTGGGDCPGLNAVIRAATRRLAGDGHDVVGVLRGWRGMIDPRFVPLRIDDVSGILPRGGTILKTSRTNPFNEEGGVEAVLQTLRQLDALIAIGGEDTLGVAHRLHAEHGAPIIGVPKTIDNDLAATDQTFGFDTAVSIATEAIDRLHTTAESHDRVMVVEVMGRHAGWLAVQSGLAGGADVVLIPEFPITVERCAEWCRPVMPAARDFSIVVVSEGWPLHPRGRLRGSRDADRRARRLRARPPRRRRRPAGRGAGSA